MFDLTTPAVMFATAFALVVAAYICSNTNERPLAGILNAAAIVVTLLGCVSAVLSYAP